MINFDTSLIPLDPLIEKRVLDSFARQKLMAAYGASITALGHGALEITVLPKDFLLRTAGMFHGGVIAALADSAGGYAAATTQPTDTSFLTIEFKINYLHPAKGEKLVTRAKVLKAGKTLTVVQSDSFIESNGTNGTNGTNESNGTLRQVATALLTFIKEKR
jgi:uncharacterized protein (TIGR00369 family)